MAKVEIDTPGVIIPIDGRHIPTDPIAAAALADLAAAIRELADAFRASFTPPAMRVDPQEEP